ncbi:MAG: sugar ABC transporter ATP-binding protein, partial [Bacilli bacterium]
AVSYNAKIVVMDEPTSSLTTSEVDKLFEIIAVLKNQGVGIIYISHKMDEIMKISDEITVIRDGKHISTDNAKDVTISEIINRMVGRELTEL